MQLGENVFVRLLHYGGDSDCPLPAGTELILTKILGILLILINIFLIYMELSLNVITCSSKT
jgi:hypothetical protein